MESKIILSGPVWISLKLRDASPSSCVQACVDGGSKSCTWRSRTCKEGERRGGWAHAFQGNANLSLIKFENKLCSDRPPLSSHAEHYAAIAPRLMSLLFTAAVADREKCPGDPSVVPERGGRARRVDAAVPSGQIGIRRNGDQTGGKLRLIFPVLKPLIWLKLF